MSFFAFFRFESRNLIFLLNIVVDDAPKKTLKQISIEFAILFVMKFSRMETKAPWVPNPFNRGQLLFCIHFYSILVFIFLLMTD